MRSGLLLGVIASCVSLNGCSNVEASNNASAEATTVSGYGPYKFAMTLDEALDAGGANGFSAYALNECRKFMPTVGCMLSPDRDNYSYPLLDGMEFAPTLEFNKYGKLTDIDEEYRQNEGVGSKDCLSLVERTLDRLVKEHGPLAIPKPRDKRSAGWDLIKGTTADKNPYTVTINRKDRNFIFDHMRSHADDENAPHVTLFSHYIGKECSIKVTYEDSAKVERLNLDRLIELTK